MDPDPTTTGNLFLKLLLLLALIFVNAFFAASEIAIISLNDNKLKRMAEEGHKKAKMVLRLTEDSSDFLATIQIGVTMAGFLTSAFAASSMSEPLAQWFISQVRAAEAYSGLVETVCLVLITLIMSFFSLVFGELVPKRVAMKKAEGIAFGAIGVLRVVASATRPIVRLLSFSTNLVVRLFGIDPHEDEEHVTEEEIRMMVDVGEEKGVIEVSQREMINNIFEFDDITAEDIMTPRTDVFALDADDPIEEALSIGVDEGYSRLPVYEEDIDHIFGVLYVKDLLPYVGKLLPEALSLRDFARPIYFVPATKRCGELFSEMTEKHIQMAVVVDEYGGVAGIVTLEDLLESIVGNIQDEFDHEEEEITQTGEHSFEADGSMDIEELNEMLGIKLPEGDYDTLAGFIMDRLGRIPAEQETVTYENLAITVLEMDDRRIDTVHIEITPSAESAPEESE